jgi:hypothetical protein
VLRSIEAGKKAYDSGSDCSTSGFEKNVETSYANYYNNNNKGNNQAKAGNDKSKYDKSAKHSNDSGNDNSAKGGNASINKPKCTVGFGDVNTGVEVGGIEVRNRGGLLGMVSGLSGQVNAGVEVGGSDFFPAIKNRGGLLGMAFGLSGHGNAGVEVGGSSAIKPRFSLGRLGISGTSGNFNSGIEVGGGDGISEIKNQLQSNFGGLLYSSRNSNVASNAGQSIDSANNGNASNKI